jgi:hypothetical protein
MLSPEYLARLGDELFPLLAGLQDAVIADVARRLKSLLEITDDLAYEIARLEYITGNRATIQREIARVLGKTDAEIARIFNSAALDSLDSDLGKYKEALAAGKIEGPIISAINTVQGQQILEGAIRVAQGRAKNLTSTLYMGNNNFVRVLDKLHLQTITGTLSQYHALRKGIHELSGIVNTVMYASGRRDQLDVALARAIRTGAAQTAGQISMMNFDLLGGNLLRTTAHAGARPDHEGWQGETFYTKIVDARFREFYSATGYGSVTGLKGANCRHDFGPVFDGIDNLSKAGPVANPAGVSNYQFYKATQDARRMERDYRALGRERNGFRAVEDEASVTKLTEEMKQLRGDYSGHTSNYGLTYRWERMIYN